MNVWLGPENYNFQFIYLKIKNVNWIVLEMNYENVCMMTVLDGDQKVWCNSKFCYFFLHVMISPRRTNKHKLIEWYCCVETMRQGLKTLQNYAKTAQLIWRSQSAHWLIGKWCQLKIEIICLKLISILRADDKYFYVTWSCIDNNCVGWLINSGGK